MRAVFETVMLVSLPLIVALIFLRIIRWNPSREDGRPVPLPVKILGVTVGVIAVAAATGSIFLRWIG